eukprot:30838-Pelagococcus_subviridis.AAC.3
MARRRRARLPRLRVEERQSHVEHERPPRVPPRREVRQRRLVPVDDGRAARAIAVRERDRVRDAVGHRAQSLRAERLVPQEPGHDQPRRDAIAVVRRGRVHVVRVEPGASHRLAQRRHRVVRKHDADGDVALARRLHERLDRGHQRVVRGVVVRDVVLERVVVHRRDVPRGDAEAARAVVHRAEAARGEGATRSASASIRIQRWGSRGLVNARKRRARSTYSNGTKSYALQSRRPDLAVKAARKSVEATSSSSSTTRASESRARERTRAAVTSPHPPRRRRRSPPADRRLSAARHGQRRGLQRDVRPAGDGTPDEIVGSQVGALLQRQLPAQDRGVRAAGRAAEPGHGRMEGPCVSDSILIASAMSSPRRGRRAIAGEKNETRFRRFARKGEQRMNSRARSILLLPPPAAAVPPPRSASLTSPSPIPPRRSLPLAAACRTSSRTSAPSRTRRGRETTKIRRTWTT